MRPRHLPRHAALALAAVSMVLPGACGSSSTDATSPTTRPGPVLTACTDSPYAPFETGSGADLQGFDIDLLDLVGARLDRPTAAVVTPLDEFGARLADGTCDLAVSALPVPAEGTSDLLFATPYLSLDQALLTRTGSGVGDWSALAGRNVGVVTGASTTVALPVDAVTATFPTAEDAVDALRSGAVDAVVTDGPLADRAVLLDPDLEVTARTPTDVRYAIATDPSRAQLLADVDAALAALEADGSLAALRTEWFGR